MQSCLKLNIRINTENYIYLSAGIMKMLNCDYVEVYYDSKNNLLGIKRSFKENEGAIKLRDRRLNSKEINGFIRKITNKKKLDCGWDEQNKLVVVYIEEKKEEQTFDLEDSNLVLELYIKIKSDNYIYLNTAIMKILNCDCVEIYHDSKNNLLGIKRSTKGNKGTINLVKEKHKYKGRRLNCQEVNRVIKNITNKKKLYCKWDRKNKLLVVFLKEKKDDQILDLENSKLIERKYKKLTNCLYVRLISDVCIFFNDGIMKMLDCDYVEIYHDQKNNLLGIKRSSKDNKGAVHLTSGGIYLRDINKFIRKITNKKKLDCEWNEQNELVVVFLKEKINNKTFDLENSDLVRRKPKKRKYYINISSNSSLYISADVFNVLNSDHICFIMDNLNKKITIKAINEEERKEISVNRDLMVYNYRKIRNIVYSVRAVKLLKQISDKTKKIPLKFNKKKKEFTVS